MKDHEVIKNYRNNDALRRSFNRLAGDTFGLDFEDWYQNGYWSDAYNPYSIVIDGQVAANVSVNRMDFVCPRGAGEGAFFRQKTGQMDIRHFIQLGTVMTREKYRGQGLSRRIMEEIFRDWEKKVDGFFLFANDGVVDFYPRFGFRMQEEVLHTGAVSTNRETAMARVPMEDKRAFDRLERIVRKSCAQSAFSLTGNSGLIMFYLTKFMRENVYYGKEPDAFAVAQIEDRRLLLYDIFSENPVEPGRVIEAFGREIREVVMGFTPVDTTGFTAGKVQEEDTTLFVKGKGFKDFSRLGVRIPLLAYA